MSLKPWYKVVTPREDLREAKPLDAAEFAVHLDRVREGNAPPDYRDPERFLARTFLTRNLLELASQVIRRLSGENTETSAVFNLATQFGGGKTHALTLLYHLADNGPKANRWTGVSQLLTRAGIAEMPGAVSAVFVGTEFDSIKGRGGDDGTPLRKTPWGEIAWQLGQTDAFARVAEHDASGQAPAGDVIRRILPKDGAALILMDEVMNFVSRSRKSGLGSQFYHFVQSLSEVARSNDRVVLAVSIPASEFEMTAEDQSDYERFKKMLDRVGKAMVMSAEAETSEIIRRRLFEWDERAVTAEGKVMLNKDALQACAEYADWIQEHRQQLPTWFNADTAREQFVATYPFHPTLISVFERKWQALPRFQQTRGVLRLLALWVSHAYSEGFKGAHKDPLIGLGTAPLDDAIFRSAVFEQLGESKLEGAVTTDICGKKDSHALRLDAEALETIRQGRVHRKVATTIFFESNGGQAKGEATQPEIRLAVGEPGLDIGNIETVLETLTEGCYYLTVERNRYRFSLKENLNKRFADRRASIPRPEVEEHARAVIEKEFSAGSGVERVHFPEKSSQVSDRPAVTLVVLSPENSLKDEKATLQLMETITREYGSSARTFKSALIFCVPDSQDSLNEEARKVLAWEAIDDEALNLDETQRQQLAENLKKSKRDLRESVWRTYKVIALLGKDNAIKKVDLGLVHSSAAQDIVGLILSRLRQDGDLESGISPNFLVRNWPPAFKEWATKSVRDAFYASPQFPRLTTADAVKETIVRGVGNGLLAYVGKDGSGGYKPFLFNQAVMTADIEFSDEMFLITKESADAFIASKAKPIPAASEALGGPVPTIAQPDSPEPAETLEDLASKPEQLTFAGIEWTGEIPPQKWMNFYTKVLSKFASQKGLKLRLIVEVTPDGGVSKTKVEETKAALRELGLPDDLSAK